MDVNEGGGRSWRPTQIALPLWITIKCMCTKYIFCNSTIFTRDFWWTTKAAENKSESFSHWDPPPSRENEQHTSICKTTSSSDDFTTLEASGSQLPNSCYCCKIVSSPSLLSFCGVSDVTERRRNLEKPKSFQKLELKPLVVEYNIREESKMNRQQPSRADILDSVLPSILLAGLLVEATHTHYSIHPLYTVQVLSAKLGL